MTDRNAMRVDEPRGDGTPEWEVFLREDAAEPLRHVGSVSAPTASVAHDHASSLFGWTADAIWVCPASEVARFTDRDLGSATDDPGYRADGDGAGTDAASAEAAGAAGRESGGDGA